MLAETSMLGIVLHCRGAAMIDACLETKYKWTFGTLQTGRSFIWREDKYTFFFLLERLLSKKKVFLILRVLYHPNI